MITKSVKLNSNIVSLSIVLDIEPPFDVLLITKSGDRVITVSGDSIKLL